MSWHQRFDWKLTDAHGWLLTKAALIRECTCFFEFPGLGPRARDDNDNEIEHRDHNAVGAGILAAAHRCRCSRARLQMCSVGVIVELGNVLASHSRVLP